MDQQVHNPPSKTTLLVELGEDTEVRDGLVDPSGPSTTSRVFGSDGSNVGDVGGHQVCLENARLVWDPMSVLYERGSSGFSSWSRSGTHQFRESSSRSFESPWSSPLSSTSPSTSFHRSRRAEDPDAGTDEGVGSGGPGISDPSDLSPFLGSGVFPVRPPSYKVRLRSGSGHPTVLPRVTRVRPVSDDGFSIRSW